MGKNESNESKSEIDKELDLLAMTLQKIRNGT